MQPGKGSIGASRDSQRRFLPETAALQAFGPGFTETACQRRSVALGFPEFRVLAAMMVPALPDPAMLANSRGRAMGQAPHL